jgi:beta-lactamase regulating signal transducer with metallopeptidase domain
VSDLGPVLVVLAAQVTLPVLGGLWLSRRRDPAAACGPLVFAAAAVLLLTPLAFAPRPAWPTASPPAPDAHETIPVDDVPATADAPGGIDVLKLLRLAKPSPVADVPERFDGWRVAAVVALGLAGIGLARLAAAFVATLQVARRGRPVTDSGLLALFDEVRLSVGCRRTVALRESARVGGAAAAGWWRPVVLVSPLWRLWTPAERRMVLAHELAHVARGDYLTRLVARLAVALHGYHPLVRWLAARLELRQEMAADARTAAACGGRAAYLKCLAGLALKADARPLALVPTFLSRPRTLLRRIAMLRVTDDATTRPHRWPAVAVALLAAAALGLHGSRPQALAGPVVPAALTETKDRPALDASFVLPSGHADEVGVFAVRVGELTRLPGTEKVAATYANAVRSLVGDGKKVYFELADIEQISGRVNLSENPKAPSPNRFLTLSLTMIRMAKEFDWVRQLKAWTTDWAEHAHGGGKLYSAKVTVPLLGFKDQPMWFYLPDARTVVLESEANIKKLIDGRGKPAAAPWADDWKAVAGGSFALVVPDVKGKLAKKLPAEKPESELAAAMLKPLGSIFGRASRAAVGIEMGEGCTINVRFACATAADAAAVDEGCQAVAKLAEAALNDDAKEEADTKFASYLVRGIEFSKTVDHMVEVRMTAKTGLADVLKTLTAGSK